MFHLDHAIWYFWVYVDNALNAVVINKLWITITKILPHFEESSGLSEDVGDVAFSAFDSFSSEGLSVNAPLQSRAVKAYKTEI
jgi:hypothetical protein